MGRLFIAGNGFNVAQKNTIIWKAENDIPEKLTTRIKDAID